jgi:uncharacterized damage-inducible protein DinB
MTPPRTRPARTADERSQLLGWLTMQGDVIAWKCEGLSEKDAHRAVLPASPLMTMAGLVAHLRWVEHCWFEVVALGRGEADNPQFDESLPEDAEMAVDDVPLTTLLEDYRRQCARSDETVAGLALDDTSRHPRFPGFSLRWILFHMIEETARHAGHADAIRELLDGERGYY